MAAASLQSRGYMPVATAALCPASVLDCNLYIQRPGSTYAELYRGAEYPLEATDLERLRSDGVDHLFIRAEDAEAFRSYLCEHVLHDPALPTATRMKALREVTRVTFQDALRANDCNRMVDVATDFGRDLACVVVERNIVFRELFVTLEHDYYTFTHVCNVSMYCAALASRLWMNSAEELAELAAGALLHDIGKRHISPEVLNKPDKLTDDEWVQVREHPVSGFRELMGRGDLSWPQLMMVYQHHERLDGSGYPAGITGDEMHPWARVCAVADVFDALTCQRPYRRAMPLADVCDYLDKYAGVWFDREAVGCWTSHVRSVAHE
jgi:HD-GYP domain-containing protein (c-di-GMP phosphodiesterase class II)